MSKAIVNRLATRDGVVDIEIKHLLVRDSAMESLGEYEQGIELKTIQQYFMKDGYKYTGKAFQLPLVLSGDWDKDRIFVETYGEQWDHDRLYNKNIPNAHDASAIGFKGSNVGKALETLEKFNADLANPHIGAELVAYQGGSVADKLDEIVSGAVTEPLVDAKVDTHNQDVDAHPELRTRIVSEVSSHVTAEADRAEAAVTQAVQDVVAGVDGQVAVAQSAANRAETALEGVEQVLDLGAANIYLDVASGLAATEDTDNFWVVPNEVDDIENLTLYNNNASEAVKLYEQINLNAYMIEESANWE